ncbi:MAG: endolytic transglycosylase MltG [Bacteroidota bacterium]
MKKWILIGLLAGGVLLFWYGYRLVFGANVMTPEGKAVEFTIATGSDYEIVGEKLKTAGLITDVRGFNQVARLMNYHRNIKPGRYMIDHGMSNRELITLLRSGNQSPVKFTFVKFRTKEQLAAYTATKLEMSEKDFLAVLNDREFLKKHNGLTPETAMTIFIPNTYEVWWTEKPEAFFNRMFKEYKRFWNDERNAKRQKWGLSRLEVMTVASIVEEETNKNDEKNTVAGVYLNRVRKKWPLEADPTVKYAVGDFTLKRILKSHLETDSPYNTYLYPGIPPGPICTPSIPSIEAVLNGEKHGYMFFCARADGSGYHHFSKTLAEHNAYAREYHRMLNEAGIR